MPGSFSDTFNVTATLFVASAVAVTVMMYVYATLGVQTTLPPLLAHPEPDAGLTKNVKSVFCVVTGIVLVSPTRMFTVGCDIEIFTTGGLRTPSLLLRPPQPAKNIKNIAAGINPATFFRGFKYIALFT
jgi:hypothetical protein